jgi:DNA-binding NarL/FixJ family response regulator
MTIIHKTYNTVIADSQYLITESLKIIIKDSDHYSNIGVVDNFCDLDLILKANQIDILITDFGLIDYEGFDKIKQIINSYPKTRILILTNHINRNELNELTRIGIKNIIYKTADSEEIFVALDATIKQKKYYSGEVLDLLMESSTNRSEMKEPAYLTPSEIEIVRQIAKGLTTKEIAKHKHVSFHTVMSHRKNIFRKLNINNASELLMYAVKNGLIDGIEYYI